MGNELKIYFLNRFSIPEKNVMYITSSYLSVLTLQNYSSQCSSCEFFMEIEKFWITEAINESSATNFIMNLSYTFYAIADAKALLSILNSSGYIQIKRSIGPPLPSVILSWPKTEYSKG